MIILMIYFGPPEEKLPIKIFCLAIALPFPPFFEILTTLTLFYDADTYTADTQTLTHIQKHTLKNRHTEGESGTEKYTPRHTHRKPHRQTDRPIHRD